MPSSALSWTLCVLLQENIVRARTVDPIQHDMVRFAVLVGAPSSARCLWLPASRAITDLKKVQVAKLFTEFRNGAYVPTAECAANCRHNPPSDADDA